MTEWSAERLGSVLPLGAILLWVGLGYAVYALQRWRGAPFRDAEMESRGATPLLGMGLRLFFSWLMRPLWRGLWRMRVSADAITVLSALLAVASGFAVAVGSFALGGWLYLATGLCDFLDGRIARTSKTAGPHGAVLDSVIDRYAEGALLVGLTYYFRADGWMIVGLLALTGSFLVPYVRARGEAAGVGFRNVGLMQRPERVVLLGFAVALSPLADALLGDASLSDTPHLLARVGLAIIGITAHLTALARLRYSLRQLDSTRPSRLLPSRPLARLALALLEAGLALALTGVGLSWPFATGLACAPFTLISCLGLSADPPPRALFVASTTALLSAGGVALLHEMGGLAAPLAWTVTRLAVALHWRLRLDTTERVSR